MKTKSDIKQIRFQAESKLSGLVRLNHPLDSEYF